MNFQRSIFFAIISVLISAVGYAQTKTKTNTVQQPKVGAPGQTQTPLDPSVQINEEQVSSVFKDMVVVQRKAKEKGGKFLFNLMTSFDFSDGPVTMYGLNTNFGYAFNDFWEVYLNYVPAFLAQERQIVKKVQSLQLNPSLCDPPAASCSATITYAKPKSQIGIDVLYIPAYGKDSWGPYSIIRSDTFFKLGISNINYDIGTGARYALLLGKTYFIANAFNLRVGAGMNYLQTIVDGEKKFTTVAVLEAGLMFYF